ncbi:MAG TPA: DHHA1 domain-containing protein, partial [Chthoniobacterales bacterium]|nr:DHHA1 domain-containing protein [Chthoniobacterales bacterium]
REVEKLVNEKIAADASVSWREIPYTEAKQRTDIMQFFGDKYGDLVRVVQIGGAPNELNGYSMELCGGTHVRTTGDIQYFRILHEAAIAAGIRRIEAVAGDALTNWAREEAARQDAAFAELKKKHADLPPLPIFAEETPAQMSASIDARAAHLQHLESEAREREKQNAKEAGAALQKRAAAIAHELVAAHREESFLVAEIPDADGNLLQAVADVVRQDFAGPIFLAGASAGRVDLIAAVPKETAAKLSASRLIQETAPIVGGKGGGRPENARGAGKDPSQLESALAKARELLSN